MTNTNTNHPLSENWAALPSFGYAHPSLIGRYTEKQMDSIISMARKAGDSLSMHFDFSCMKKGTIGGMVHYTKKGKRDLITSWTDPALCGQYTKAQKDSLIIAGLNDPQITSI